MKQQDEKLSLLLDDHSDDDIDAVLDEVIADVNLQYRVRRYQMIGDVLRNELPVAIDTGFHQRVMAQVQQQAEPDDPVGNPRVEVAPRGLPAMARAAWFRPFAGLAVAASNRVQSEGMRWKLQNESPMVQQKLNSYLVNHTEYSNSMQGLIPQARVAGFDAQ